MEGTQTGSLAKSHGVQRDGGIFTIELGKKVILHSVVDDMGKQTRGCNLI